MQRIITLVNRKTEELLRESRRKSIHALIAFVPFIAYYSYLLAFFMLGCGIMAYSWSEFARLAGKRIFIISDIKDMVFRKKDMHHFAVAPVTLALGAMSSLSIFGGDAASVAIYSLAFGDSFACLIGKTFGRVRIPFAGGKTFAGSLACFVTVVFITNRVSGGNIYASLLTALVATLAELIPVGDFDNITMPLATALAYTILI